MEKVYIDINQACSTYYVMRVALVKYCLHRDNMNLIAQRAEGIPMRVITSICVVIPVCISTHYVF